ncbi:hypothetical protein [Variovorax sp. GT1P44]|uniref:hypothetical protein n=1 Tax=Variovorax sp. GT1P44 TaxID=3443742 RepID=UPI003F459A17
MKLSHHRIARQGAVFLAGACLQWAALAADGVNGTWRCGNTYTDQPCQGGKALDIEDTRDAAQKRAADQTTRDAQAAADRLERDRLRLESTSARASLIDNKPRSTAKSSRQDKNGAQKPKKAKKDPVFVSGPASPPTKKASKSAKKS